jgi:hypothetical protein
MVEQQAEKPTTPEQGQEPKPPIDPSQKISLVWVFFGIGGILLMWLISSKVF